MGGLLNRLPAWLPDKDFILSGMQAPPYRRIRLERFPRGIDNVRVDVVLDPEFVDVASTLVRVVLREDVHRHFWKVPVKAPHLEAADVFRDAYIELSQSVVRQARAASRPERVQLFQLAVFKLLLGLVDKEMASLGEELDEARAQPSRQQSGQSLQLHERKVILMRYAREIRFRALKDVLRLVVRVEQSSLRKVRKTILGVSWPLSDQMLSAPSLQLGGRGSAEDFIVFFPYLLYDDEKSASLLHHVMEVFSDWLPRGVVPPKLATKLSGKEDRSRGEMIDAPGLIETERSVFHLIGEEERLQAVPHAFDDGAAVVGLLGGAGDSWPRLGRWSDKRLLKVFRARFRDLYSRLHKAGLLKEIQASYLLKAIYPALGLPHSVDLVYAFLLGEVSRRELIKRLRAMSEVDDPEAVANRLDELLRRYRAVSRAEQRKLLMQCVHDAISYRYQLKLAWWMLNGMEDVHLLFDAREQEMSQANALLQVFKATSAGDVDADAPVAGHVIIKADLRGSTEITASMRERNLNPAAYFSRDFYDPITALLRDYGAEKVFVEGDAVILAVIERGSEGEQLAVARACGLAQRILEVVELKNARSLRLELPMLELGIGIAYSNEAPTYLFDEGHKIMISPAINRADRLSSCDSRLRNLLYDEGVRSGVEVVSRQATDTEEAALTRFNVNGIELEAPAFVQLVKGLKLHRLQLPDERGLFYAGRYPDVRRQTHWLILREAPVRQLVGTQIGEEKFESRRFYQVVTDKQLREEVQRRVGGKSSP